MLALAMNTVVSKEIRDHRYFMRFVDAVSEVGATGNCIMGLQKDVKENVQENLLIVKLNQGNSQEEAMRECEKIVWDQTIEAIRHAQLLIEVFPNDQNITNYIKASFNMMNNGTQFYLKMSDRYKTMQVEKFKLPLFDNEEEQFNFIFKQLLPKKNTKLCYITNSILSNQHLQ
jgi:nitrate reductase alpha subunit